MIEARKGEIWGETTNACSISCKIVFLCILCMYTCSVFGTPSHGGSGGVAFDDFSIGIKDMEVKTIVIRSGKMIDSIQVVYRVPGGKDESKVTDTHGGTGGMLHVLEIDVDNGEYVTDVFGRSGRLVDKLWFLTNKGRVLGPVGGDGGVLFHESCRLRGFFGRAGKMLDAIGFYCSGVKG